jgi:hypothetical protein
MFQPKVNADEQPLVDLIPKNARSVTKYVICMAAASGHPQAIVNVQRQSSHCYLLVWWFGRLAYTKFVVLCSRGAPPPPPPKKG